MIEPPELIDGARVLYWADVSTRHMTGHVVHYGASQRQEDFACIAIAQYGDGAGEAYLFHCNTDWRVLNDDRFETVDEAIASALHQYRWLTRQDLAQRSPDPRRGRTRG